MKEWAIRIGKENEAKTLFSEHNTPRNTAKMVIEEGVELDEAIALGKDKVEVAAEIGDVLYLTLFLCYRLGINPEEALRMKDVRNEIKYPPEMLQEGDYETRRAELRLRWEEMGGDKKFYETYAVGLLDLIHHDC